MIPEFCRRRIDGTNGIPSPAPRRSFRRKSLWCCRRGSRSDPRSRCRGRKHMRSRSSTSARMLRLTEHRGSPGGKAAQPATNFPRLRALALFGRRPQEREEPFVIRRPKTCTRGEELIVSKCLPPFSQFRPLAGFAELLYQAVSRHRAPISCWTIRATRWASRQRRAHMMSRSSARSDNHRRMKSIGPASLPP
jgi:hypothetical protein